MHEASAIDGANWWPKLRHVVLPYLRGPVLLACLLATLNHINNFTLPFVLFGAPAPDDVNVMPMIVYVTSFQSLRFGLQRGHGDRVAAASSPSRCSSTCGRSGWTSTRKEAGSDGHRDCHRPTGRRRKGKGRAASGEAHRLLPGPAAGRSSRRSCARWC